MCVIAQESNEVCSLQGWPAEKGKMWVVITVMVLTLKRHRGVEGVRGQAGMPVSSSIFGRCSQVNTAS